jgi:hypothetical protein
MKKVMLVLGIIALLVVSTSAFAADPIAGHPGSTVTPPVAGAAKVVPPAVTEQLAEALADVLGDGAVVAPLEPARAGEVVADTTLRAVEANLTRDVLPVTQNAELIPVVFPQLIATVEFDADNKAAVAFGADKSDISDQLDLAPGETLSGIKSQIRLFLVTDTAGTLTEITDFSIVEDNDGVYFAFVLDGRDAISVTSARAASNVVTIEPVVVRVHSVDSGDNGGGGGGCDAGFSGAAAMLALAGAAIMRGRARG